MATHNLRGAVRTYRTDGEGLENLRNATQGCCEETYSDDILEYSIHTRDENRYPPTWEWSFLGAGYFLLLATMLCAS